MELTTRPLTKGVSVDWGKFCFNLRGRERVRGRGRARARARVLEQTSAN